MCHIYLCTQYKCARYSITTVHEAEKAQALFCGTVAEWAVGACFRRGAFLLGNHFGALLIDISAALHDEPLGKVPKFLEIIAGVIDIVPLESQPLDIVFDAIDIFGVLFRGICVIEAQIAFAAILLGDAKVDGDGFCVTDVQIAVGFGRETRLYATTIQSFGQIFLYFLLYEV